MFLGLLIYDQTLNEIFNLIEISFSTSHFSRTQKKNKDAPNEYQFPSNFLPI